MMCLPPATSNLQFAPMVYAAGDNICFTNPKTGKPVPAVAHVAILEGAIAAHNVLEDIRHAIRAGFSLEEIHKLSHIDPWFLQQIKEIVELEDALVKAGSLEALV